MSKTLVIVESGKKGKTIGNILGEGYKVLACGGHIRDMPVDGDLGFDRDSLQIHYELSSKSKHFVTGIQKLIKSGHINHVILASDPDREGEAIAHALKEEIGLADNQYERCKFNEITKEAITKAIKGSGGEGTLMIDDKMVDAQETRRILDRYIGWVGTRAVSGHLLKFCPMGRVQSQALRFVVEREKEIHNFEPKDYYSLSFTSKEKAGEAAIDSWCSKLDTEASGVATKVVNGESMSNVWLDKAAAEKLKKHLDTGPSAKCIKSFIENRITTPPPPFTTTTMQQAAINNLGLSGKQVDKLAQELYQEGYITYPRTDSTRMSDEGHLLLLEWGKKNGVEVLEKKRNFTAGEDAQDAHECIRPAVIDKEPKDLSADHLNLFKLILARAVMSQMPPKEYEHRESHFSVEFEGVGYVFKSEGNTTLVPGFTTFYKNNTNVSDEDADSVKNDDGEATLPLFKEGETVKIERGELKTKKTRAPGYYTQAKLNKKLDEKGIGRPSTYSSIFEKIVAHEYVRLVKSKKKAAEIHATSLGIEIVNATQDVFNIMNPDYTREMEEKLDAVASNTASKDEVAHKFLDDFDNDLKKLSSIERSVHEYTCSVDGCGGTLWQFEKTRDDGSVFSFYRCQKCHQVHWLSNGVPVIPEDILAPFLNSDGSAKYPCPECGSAMRRIQRKDGGYFWKCSNNKLDKTDKKAKRCEYAANDYNEAPDHNNEGVAARREAALQKAREEGLVSDCPICSHEFVEYKGVNKEGKPYHFGKCDHCNYFSMPNEDGIFYHKKADKVLEYLDGDKPKAPCPKCGAALYKSPSFNKKTKEWKDLIYCSGVYKINRKENCTFKNTDMSVEVFEGKIDDYDATNG